MALLQGNQMACPATAASATRQAQRANGLASVLGVGTANPANCVRQEAYADYYFRVTKSEHLTDLKAKFKRICHKSGINKRYFHHTEDLLQGYPEFIDRSLPSLDARLDIVSTVIPELAGAAAVKAIAEWGRPATDITHLVVATYSGAHMPGADLRLAALLGLRPSVRRTMLYHNGCASASAALRVAKDIAENNRGARVLVACAEATAILFRAPDAEARVEALIMQALFGDGAGAVVVGADPAGELGSESGERPLFEMVAASQTVVPGTEHAAVGQVGEDGFVFYPSMDLPRVVGQNIERCVVDALAPLGVGGGWNDLFWAVHPGGPAILDSVEAKLRLQPSKLEASRRVLREYGNMSGVTVIFVLDELIRRRRSQKAEVDGLGVMVGIGPGVTIETMVLYASDGTI
ncbi:hypothetical protein EJB05_05244, partial [Eragrostis curvula]